LPELHALQQKTGASLLYEGACCASIPIIRNLEEYYDNDLLTSVEGIFNGTTNYILSKVLRETSRSTKHYGWPRKMALPKVIRDSIWKVLTRNTRLCILLLHAFGVFVEPESVFHFGIHRLNAFDAIRARRGVV
jgi:homoserine dehydrogenase